VKLRRISRHAPGLPDSTLPGFEPINPWKSEQLVITRRRLPHFEVPGATYFVTLKCVRGRELGSNDREVVLRELQSVDGSAIDLDGAVVMPDHAHAILRLVRENTLGRVLQRIKGRSARFVNQIQKMDRPLWLGESFDHIVRDGNELEEKLAFLRRTPVKEGLVTVPEEYEWLFVKSW
jgi:REP element-mobilizing transposase RayT